MTILNIQPVNYLNEIATKVIMHVSYYDLNSTYCEVTWTLLDENESQIIINKDIVDVSVVENWNTDDMVIVNHILEKNNLTLIN